MALVEQFDDLVALYDVEFPFVRSGQYELHRRTIDARRNAGSLTAALASDAFLSDLYATLRSWGIGKRASRLVEFEAFANALRSRSDDLRSLEPLRFEELGSTAGDVGGRVWDVITRLGVVDNIALIVSGSKTLHHLLPDLVPPMDREWTGRFFDWSPPDLQQHQRSTFVRAFEKLAMSAADVHPSRLVGEGWRTSQTKIVDNAVVAYMAR